MPNYVSSSTDGTKQVPGPLSDQHYDRTGTPASCVLTKTPNYVIVKNITGTTDLGFFFGSSASYADASRAEGTLLPTLTGSANYASFGAPAAGTRLDISPTAWSGSSASSVVFIYKGGLDGAGRGH